MVDTETFSKVFKDFIKPYNCTLHKQSPTFICIEQKCEAKGMICSKCLTISGQHKNHTSIDVLEFLEHCLKSFSHNDTKKDEMSDLVKRIDEQFEDILKILTDFHETVSMVIKTYISKKNDFHTEKESHLVINNLVEQFKTCRFKSLDEMNKTLSVLISRFPSKFEQDSNEKELLLEKTQNYLDDLAYESKIIGRELTKIEDDLNQLLNVKASSPVVLYLSPTFSSPSFNETKEIVYIGETKNNQPNGKGVCYFKNSDKIYFGEFKNGQMEGFGESYEANGDFYRGQFKLDKKEGRGIFEWTGAESKIYEGEFLKGKRNGRGTFWWPDGSWYEGQFRGGIQSGYGILYRKKGDKEYEGSWHNGLFDGKGTQYFDNGEKYEGSFKEDKFHGEGIFYKLDSIVHGAWKENELSVVNMVKTVLNDK